MSYHTRLALYAEAEQERNRRETATVDARTKQMLGSQRTSRVDNATNAARRLKEDVEWVLDALGNGDIRAAGFSIAGMAERIGIIADNLKQVEAVDDALEIINSETAEAAP